MVTEASIKSLPVTPPPAKCFKDATRDCDASCMAYVQPPNVVKGRWEFCRLLVDGEQTNRHLKVIADVMNKVGTYIDDERRFQQPPPPGVR